VSCRLSAGCWALQWTGPFRYHEFYVLIAMLGVRFRFNPGKEEARVRFEWFVIFWSFEFRYYHISSFLL
jgi:hypothetical protein